MWAHYHAAFETLERAGHARRPFVPADCGHNGHIYYLLVPDAARRPELLAALNRTASTRSFTMFRYTVRRPA